MTRPQFFAISHDWPYPVNAARWAGEVCKRCRRRNNVAWSVPDAIWEAVVKSRWNVLCPACFDEEAERLGVAYEFDAHLDLLSWSDWLTGA